MDETSSDNSNLTGRTGRRKEGLEFRVSVWVLSLAGFRGLGDWWVEVWFRVWRVLGLGFGGGGGLGFMDGAWGLHEHQAM